MRSYLFVHQNFPGQFPHVARALAERGDTVVAIGEEKRLTARGSPHPRIHCIGYPKPQGAGKDTHHYLRMLEAHTRRGQAVLRAAQPLVARGFKPDVVVAHPGWGETLFLREIFPLARHVHYMEFFYRAEGADVGFDPEFPITLDDRCRIRLKTATQLVGFESADAGIAPTAWQKSGYPKDWQHRIAQLHDGIDTARAVPNPDVTMRLRAGIDGMTGELQLSRKDEVLTYVARNLEPYRGFHVFMRAVPLILQQRPQARIVVVGGDDVSYGGNASGGRNWREHCLQYWGKEVDRTRVHFVGRLPYGEYLKVLQLSSLHVYLTYPFVLSWSMLEAMSSGCVILGSATPPVQEVIRDGENGFLTGFFDAERLASRAAELLAMRAELQHVRNAARETAVSNYDLHGRCLPALLSFLQEGTALS